LLQLSSDETIPVDIKYTEFVCLIDSSKKEKIIFCCWLKWYLSPEERHSLNRSFQDSWIMHQGKRTNLRRICNQPGEAATPVVSTS